MACAVRREELDRLEAEWLGLLSLSPEPVPFLHPTWQRAWLEEFQEGRDLLLLAVRDGERLVGLAPLLRQDCGLTLVGHYSICDYMDVVAAPGRESEVIAAVLEALQGEEWRELELRGLREGSPTLALLPALAEGLGWQVSQELEAVSPRLELPATWEEYLARLSGKDRHELRRKLRRLAQGREVELRVLTSSQETAAGLAELLRFMVESREDKARFLTEKMEQFFYRAVAALSEEGMVRLYLLELDGRTAAAVLCFDLGNRLYVYNSGYDPAYASLAVGLLSKALCLRDAIEQGRQCLDFLRGTESYKYDLGARDQRIYRCLIGRR